MRSASRPWWQQATALVSLSASGAVTGFSFAPRAPAGPASPASMPIRLLALEQAARSSPADDATLRAAIVNVQVLPPDGAEQDPCRDGEDHLAAGQHRRCRPRPVVRGLRQPDAGACRPGNWPAQLGDRR